MGIYSSCKFYFSKLIDLYLHKSDVIKFDEKNRSITVMKVKELLIAIIVIICLGILYWKFDGKIVTAGVLLVSSIYQIIKSIKNRKK